MKTKQCTKCGENKSLMEYYKDKSKRLGVQSYCKTCSRMLKKAYHNTTKDAHGKKRKAYYAENKERILEKNRKSYAKNKERIAERRKAYYAENKEHIKAKGKAYYVENKERIIERINKYGRERWERDPVYRMRKNVSRQVQHALFREHGSKRGASTFDHLPYTPEQLKEHLQAQFDAHMTWDNYGSYWHIDHIYPQSMLPYDSLDHPHFSLVWDLNNLRPLSAEENVRKQAQLTEPIPEHIKLFLENQQIKLDK